MSTSSLIEEDADEDLESSKHRSLSHREAPDQSMHSQQSSKYEANRADQSVVEEEFMHQSYSYEYEAGEAQAMPEEEEAKTSEVLEFHLKLTQAEYERYLREKAASGLR